MTVALVLGGAKQVWDDAARAHHWLLESVGRESFDIVVAINDMGCMFPKITHLATLHPEKLAGWVEERYHGGFNMDFIAVTTPKPAKCRVPVVPDVPVLRSTEDWGVSSGIYGIKVALEDGADSVILAGVPMDASPNLFRQGPWKDFHHYQIMWSRQCHLFAPKTRSMSGWSMEQLGAPDISWLTR